MPGHSNQIADEETPLLRSDDAESRKETPIPWRQLLVVLFLQLEEPLTSQVIYPFIPQLIRDVGVTHGDETRVGYYVGLMQSLFYVTQTCTVLNWSRLSDHIGRKPVILIGLFGLSLSMCFFGLSRSFWALTASRSLAGALNGNVGVIKSVMGELTDETNIARAYAYQPLAWSTGAAIGPLIGGFLSRPTERFPRLFGHSDFLKVYPYFLPCAVSAMFCVMAWIVAFFFLKETNPGTVSIRTLICRRAADRKFARQRRATSNQAIPLRSLFTRRVLVAAGNYASISFLDIMYRAIHPVFLATPVALGGLGLAPPAIGGALAILGVANGAFQILCFAWLHAALGTRRLFLLGASAAFPIFALFPVMSALARAHGVGAAVWTAVALQLALSMLLNVCYSCVFIYITAAAPSRRALGATNGLAQMSVSVARAAGPALATSLYSLSLERGYLHGQLVYAVLLLCSSGAFAGGVMLPYEVWQRSSVE